MTPLQTFYILHHSHTDIGFTHDQPILWELHRRFLDRAIDLAERDLGCDESHAFRWTAETLGPVLHWLNHASARQVERFLKVVHGGRIEVTAMFAHSTPLADTTATIEMLQCIHKARGEYGLPIRHALNCDINGHNWPLTDALLDAGIETLTMSINEFNGGAPFIRPTLFRWQAPSRRELLTLNNWIYHMGNFCGISDLLHVVKPKQPSTLEQRLEKFAQSLPVFEKILARAKWDMPIALLQCSHPFGDNAPPDATMVDFVRAWNRRGEGPRLCLATPSIWWNAVRKTQADFPVVHGDWTDYWTFGAGASAREVAVAKEAQIRLQAADALLSVLPSLEADLSSGEKDSAESSTDADSWFTLIPHYRAEAWKALHLWNEHTFEADSSSSATDGTDSAAQWNHKAHQAWKLHSLSKLLARDAVAELSRQVRREKEDHLLIYNALPWSRIISGPIPDTIRYPRGRGDDPISSRHYQDHESSTASRLHPVEVPALGYVLVSPAQLSAPMPSQSSPQTVMANSYHQLVFDHENGGLLSWSSTDEKRQWLDQKSPWKGATVIREEPITPPHTEARAIFSNHDESVWTVEGHRRNWTPGWKAKRISTCRVTSHVHENLADGQRVIQQLSFDEAHLPAVEIRTFLPSYAPWVEFEIQFVMGMSTDPEAYYFALPFALNQPSAYLDAGGQAILVGRDQLPGTNRDYFINHKWCALEDRERTITVATPINPLVMFGGFHFGDNRPEASIDNGLFLGWITNNYWFCNFRARQPGLVCARYRVLPHSGKFSETEAHRFGAEAAAPPLLHNLMEPSATTASLPSSGSLLQLPTHPILTMEISPGWSTLDQSANTFLLRLLNASDELQSTIIGSGLLKIIEASHCNFFGKPLSSLPLQKGEVKLTIEPRRMVVIQLKTQLI